VKLARVQQVDGVRPEELHTEDPEAPQVGRWYWVKPEEEGEKSEEVLEGGDEEEEGKKKEAPRRYIACVTKLGSNYVELTYIKRGHIRIRNDIFWSLCEFIHDADALLRGEADRCQREIRELLEEVKLLTAKLGVTTGLALLGAEASATSLTLASNVPVDTYKAALVKAKEETLPAIFKKIEAKSEEFRTWLSAQIIPMKAESEKLEPAIERVEDRIFSVELYAGLCEEVELIKDGSPAALTEPVHLFQRRLYMDEECLANFDTGGMEFKNLGAFERWLCRKDNFARVFPFPRTIVAFRVRRNKKERETMNLRDFVQLFDIEKLDKLTFLYIRNGGRVYRLSTEIDFDSKLFPDLDHPVLAAGEGRLYWRSSSLYDNSPEFITEVGYQGIVKAEKEAEATYQRRLEEEKKKPKEEREYVWHDRPRPASYDYIPFTKDSVYYDDAYKRLRQQMEKHNRIVLVLQGLLDRSQALHPHPQWRLFEGDGFAQALVLHRDSDRVLVAGEKPNFEVYRAKLNESIKVGSVTVGQQEAWLLFEGKRESNRRDRDYRWRRVDYRPRKWQPEGDPGPGRFARVARLDRGGRVHYQWEKERKQGSGPSVGRKYGCKTSRIFNIDAYTPGDYKRFFEDPRTRAEYLQWAPFLLAAEMYHAGKYEPVPELKALPPRGTRPAPTGEANRRRAMRALLGKAVRLTQEVETKGGKTYKAGTLWRVQCLEREGFTMYGLTSEGKHDERGLRSIPSYYFEVEESIASDPNYEYKPPKRAKVTSIDDGEEGDE
jgi:hypothetical protein